MANSEAATRRLRGFGRSCQRPADVAHRDIVIVPGAPPQNAWHNPAESVTGLQAGPILNLKTAPRNASFSASRPRPA